MPAAEPSPFQARRNAQKRNRNGNEGKPRPKSSLPDHLISFCAPVRSTSASATADSIRRRTLARLVWRCTSHTPLPTCMMYLMRDWRENSHAANRPEGGEREKARQIRRPRRVGRAMSVCTLAGSSAIPAAIGARAHMRADCKSIPSHITLLSFLLRKRRVAVRRKNYNIRDISRKKAIPFVQESGSIGSRRERAPPLPLHLHFNYLRNGILEQQTPPLPHFSRWVTSRPHHHQHFISRRRRPGFPIEFRK